MRGRGRLGGDGWDGVSLGLSVIPTCWVLRRRIRGVSVS